MILGFVFAAIIELSGVSGSDLYARAYFDSNNVKLGDPMTLYVDFIGTADFPSLHPPKLAKAVDSREWKIDQESAKTDTFKDGRRLTYRVRPVKTGVLWLPEFRFSYNGGEGFCATAPVPVHVKPGAQIEIELAGSEEAMPPLPDESLSPLSPGDDFAWRRDFYSGKFQDALSALERHAWDKGQTPYMESAMIATRARLLGNPYAELPAWRVVARALLKHPLGRQITIVLSFIFAAAVLFAAIGKTIRHFAAVSLIVVTMSNPNPKVGEAFDFLFSIPKPESGKISVMRFEPGEKYGLSILGKGQAVNDSLVRLPVRYDVPVKDLPLVWTVYGKISERQEINQAGFHMVSESSRSFAESAAPVLVNVSPLDPENQPEDFSGIVAEDLGFLELPDMLDVETNDVIAITYRLAFPKDKGGFVPRGWKPEGAAYWWAEGEWKGYFVADGAESTPFVEFCYYDPKSKSYKRAKTGGAKIKYHE